MSKQTKIAVVIAITAALGGILLFAWLVVGRGFGTREQPSALEAFVAQRLRSMATPRAGKEMRNPVPLSEQARLEAMAHFADHCALCHGNDGSGETTIGQGLYPKPPDMRQFRTQNLTDGELFYIIHNGVRLTGMPAFGQGRDAASDLDSWKLVHFIRHLPKLTSQELEAMKGMNPKSRHELEEEEAIERFLAGEDVQPPPSGHNHD